MTPFVHWCWIFIYMCCTESGTIQHISKWGKYKHAYGNLEYWQIHPFFVKIDLQMRHIEEWYRNKKKSCTGQYTRPPQKWCMYNLVIFFFIIIAIISVLVQLLHNDSHSRYFVTQEQQKGIKEMYTVGNKIWSMFVDSQQKHWAWKRHH